MTSTRSTKGRNIAISLAGVLAVAGVLVFIVTQYVAPSLASPIESVTYSQMKAVEGFDTSEHTMKDAKQIARFTALLKKHNVDEMKYPSASAAPCTGGLSTYVTINFDNGTKSKMFLSNCGGNTTLFVQDVTTLVAGWKNLG